MRRLPVGVGERGGTGRVGPVLDVGDGWESYEGCQGVPVVASGTVRAGVDLVTLVL